MSRYIQQVDKPTKEKKEPREMTKPGSYTSEQLGDAKKIPTKDGYK